MKIEDIRVGETYTAYKNGKLTVDRVEGSYVGGLFVSDVTGKRSLVVVYPDDLQLFFKRHIVELRPPLKGERYAYGNGSTGRASVDHASDVPQWVIV